MDATAQQILMILGGILAGGLGVNFFAQVIKKAFRLKADAVIHFMVMTVSFIAAGAQYVISLKYKLPPEILGISATAIYGFSQATFKVTRQVSGYLGKVQAAEALLNAQNAPATFTTSTAVPMTQTITVSPSASSTTSSTSSGTYSTITVAPDPSIAEFDL